MREKPPKETTIQVSERERDNVFFVSSFIVLLTPARPSVSTAVHLDRYKTMHTSDLKKYLEFNIVLISRALFTKKLTLILKLMV